jgi:hypothetical protein
MQRRKILHGHDLGGAARQEWGVSGRHVMPCITPQAAPGRARLHLHFVRALFAVDGRGIRFLGSETKTAMSAMPSRQQRKKSSASTFAPNRRARRSPPCCPRRGETLSVTALELGMQQTDACLIYQVEVWPINRLPKKKSMLISPSNLIWSGTNLAINGIIFTLWFFL